MGGIRKIMVLWQAVFLAASPLVTAPPSNLTRLYYNGSAAKSHSTTTQYRQLRRLCRGRQGIETSKLFKTQNNSRDSTWNCNFLNVILSNPIHTPTIFSKAYQRYAYGLSILWQICARYIAEPGNVTFA